MREVPMTIVEVISSAEVEQPSMNRNRLRPATRSPVRRGRARGEMSMWFRNGHGTLPDGRSVAQRQEDRAKEGNLRSGLFVPAKEARKESVESKETGAEDQDDQGGPEEGEGGSGHELVRIGEDRVERFIVSGDVGDDEVDGQHERDNPGEEADRQKQPAEALQTGDKRGRECRRRDVQAGEEVGNV